MLKILINAYACSPNMGSEPGMAWNWCINLAKYCELHIITEGEFKDQIEAIIPSLPQGKNMHFYYNPVSEEVRKMCWNQGDWRFYYHYKKWQKKTLKIAKEIINNEKIDIIHQLNMIGFREPGYLWKIENLPFVWGPVDAKESFPIGYLNQATITTKIFISLKNIITKFQLTYDKRIKSAVKKAKLIFSASSNSLETFRKYYNKETILLNETGCNIKENPLFNKIDKEFLDLLWVGKFDFRKQLNLAIESLAQTKNKKIRLNIIGSGNVESYKKLSEQLDIHEQCIFHGIKSHQEVQKIMLKSDLLFFTSVAEGTPHVVLEAISNNLPILAINTCGQGDVINQNIGIKIELTNYEQSKIDFARELNKLFIDRNILFKMSKNCKQRQIEMSWEKKTEQMVNLFYEILIN